MIEIWVGGIRLDHRPVVRKFVLSCVLSCVVCIWFVARCPMRCGAMFGQCGIRRMERVFGMRGVSDMLRAVLCAVRLRVMCCGRVMVSEWSFISALLCAQRQNITNGSRQAYPCSSLPCPALPRQSQSLASEVVWS